MGASMPVIPSTCAAPCARGQIVSPDRLPRVWAWPPPPCAPPLHAQPTNEARNARNKRPHRHRGAPNHRSRTAPAPPDHRLNSLRPSGRPRQKKKTGTTPAAAAQLPIGVGAALLEPWVSWRWQIIRVGSKIGCRNKTTYR